MKILIDARFYGAEQGGIGRYVAKLIENLQDLDTQNQYLILLRKKYYQELKFNPPNFKKVLADIPHYSLKEQLILPFKIASLKPDLCHFPHFNIPIFYFGKFVVTIHDLIKHQYYSQAATTRNPLVYFLKHWFYYLVIGQAIKRAKKVIVPSNWIKKEILHKYHIGEEKIVVTYEAAEETYQVASSKKQVVREILEKYKIKKPYVIYTGSAYPYKNLEKLLSALKIINQFNSGTYYTKNEAKLRLVICCGRSVFWERLKKKIGELGIQDLVVLPGFLEDEELVVLYKNAEAFVTPSLSEGFGLPGIEAMASGCPVVSSDASCLPEVYQDAALYFNPRDEREIAAKIEEVISSQTLRQDLIERGLKRTSEFSWQKMAQETLKVYNSSE